MVLALGAAVDAGWGAQARAQPVAAPAATRAFALDIPASGLDSAVLALGTSLGLRVFFEPQRLAGLTTPGLKGRFTPGQALARLLEGTGLGYRFTGPNSVRLEAVPAGAAPEAVHDAVSDAGPVRELPTVVVTAQSEQPRDQPYRTAGSGNVLTRDDIERFRGTSVGDIFKGTTGVLVGENRNSGGLDVNIRGMQGQGRVPVLVDGARQETTVWRGYAGVASRSYVDPDLIGGIQIDKGPTLSAQGTGATGGLVSMRTLNAEDIVKPGETFGLRLRGQAIGNNSGSPVEPGTPAGLFTGVFPAGTEAIYRTHCVNASICSGAYALPTEWGTSTAPQRPGTFEARSGAGSLSVARRLESIDLVAVYAQRNQGNYYAGTHGPSAWVDVSNERKRPFYTEVRPVIRGASRFEAGERIPGTNFESRSALLKARLYLPAEQELELSYMRYKSAYSEIMPSQIVRFGNLSPITQPRNSEVAADTYTSRYHWNPAGNPLLDLRASLWHTRTRAINNSPSETQLNLYNNERETYKRWGLTLENTSSLGHGGWGESQLRYGLAAQLESVGTVPLAEDFRGLAGRSGDRDEYSAFAAWQYKPVPSVVFDAGLRHTRFKSSDDKPITIADPRSPRCVDAGGDGQCDPLPNRNAQSGTTPVVSLGWEPGNAGLQFYGRYAEALRMPSLFESTTGFSFEAAPDVVLKPEHAKNREVGINYLRDGVLGSRDRLRLKLAYFRNHTKDYLTRTSPNLWEEGGSQAIATNLTMRNIDSASFYGVELSGSYDMGVFFTEFGATKYNKIELCHTGSYRVHPCNNYGVANSYINNMVPPRWHANLTLGARLLEHKLTVGVRAIFMGERNNTPRYNDDTSRGVLAVVPWHAYRVFDLFASYRVNDSVAVDFNLDNATDRYYLDALSLGLMPAPGRTARMSLTLRF